MQFPQLGLFLVRGRSSHVSQKQRDMGHPACIRRHSVPWTGFWDL